MKKIVGIVFLLLSITVSAQVDYYTKGGVAVDGYDVTEYFNKTPKKGVKEYSVNYDGTQFYFVNEKNKTKFEATPKSFIPQYGGYCAYAIGTKGDKVKINPETYEIRDGKLYLFYNSWGTNTLDLWHKEGAEALRINADKNWEKIKNKQ